MSGDHAYLDYNATAPVRPEVAEAVTRALGMVGNPSSVHGPGQAARRAVEAARRQVAVLAGARPAEVAFTSGGTEANNLALKGTGAARLIVSAIEHDSVLSAAAEAAAERVLLGAGGDGVVDLAELERLLANGPRPTLVSVMLANNETGVIQPLAEVVALAGAAGALVHCDAVQAPGRIAFDLSALGVDLLTLSAHKLGGPKGVGALIVREGTRLQPIHHGGGQEFGRRAGTENVPGIVGFGVAAELAANDLAAAPGLARRRDDLESRLRALAPGLTVYGAGMERLPNTSCVSMPGVSSETQVMALDLAGVAVSAGAACSSGKVTPSHVLRAMGVTEVEARSAIRVSLGRHTTEGEIDRLVEAWRELYERTAAAPIAQEPAA